MLSFRAPTCFPSSVYFCSLLFSILVHFVCLSLFFTYTYKQSTINFCICINETLKFSPIISSSSLSSDFNIIRFYTRIPKLLFELINTYATIHIQVHQLETKEVLLRLYRVCRLNVTFANSAKEETLQRHLRLLKFVRS